jgi:hypothetical protein
MQAAIGRLAIQFIQSFFNLLKILYYSNNNNKKQTTRQDIVTCAVLIITTLAIKFGDFDFLSNIKS